MSNCIVVITRHYSQKMFSGRWTAIQNQFSIIAAKLGYSIPSSLDIHAYRRPYEQSNSYVRKPSPVQYPHIPPLLSMDTQLPSSMQTLQKSFEQFTQNVTHDYYPRQASQYQSEQQPPSYTPSYAPSYPPPQTPGPHVKSNYPHHQNLPSTTKPTQPTFSYSNVSFPPPSMYATHPNVHNPYHGGTYTQPQYQRPQMYH